MVVEDEPDIYDVLLAMFEIWGIDGVAFVNGEETVAWLDQVDRGNAVGELPELAILDIRLPEMQGPVVAEFLRKSARLHDIAIVMITAYRLSPSAEEAVIQQAQADTLMYKPLPAMPELRARLDKIIAVRKERAQTASNAPTTGANVANATAPSAPISNISTGNTTRVAPVSSSNAPTTANTKAESNNGSNGTNTKNTNATGKSTGTDSGHAKP
jgi:CheY-like chemotaxis protein